MSKVGLRRLSTVVLPPDVDRVSTGIAGLDTCLAEADDAPAGLPLGTSVLLSGAPGGGKSTLALLMADAMKDALVLHGEEPEASVKRRWERLKLVTDPWLSQLRDAERALDDIRDTQARLVVVDSVQTIVMDGSRRHDAQLEAAEMLVGQACGSGGSVVLISHVSKNGKDHAGAMGLAHLVDVHLHVTTNAHKGTRMLEVRKNRHGRAGFEVPLVITQRGVDIGAPTAQSSLASARTALEKASDRAFELLEEGKTLTAYDFDVAGVSAGMWRAGLEMAVRRMVRDGREVEETKVKGRRAYRLVSDTPTTGADLPDIRPIELD